MAVVKEALRSQSIILHLEKEPRLGAWVEKMKSVWVEQICVDLVEEISEVLHSLAEGMKTHIGVERHASELGSHGTFKCAQQTMTRADTHPSKVSP